MDAPLILFDSDAELARAITRAGPITLDTERASTMNEPFYTRGISVYLAEFFQELVQGGKSDFEARALLIERLADFNTRLIPPLPPGEYLRLLNKIVGAKAPFHFSLPAAVEAAVEAEVVPASSPGSGNRAGWPQS